MRQQFYEYSRDDKRRYRFVSKGKRNIIKIVAFSTTNRKKTFNLWFGDLLPDNSIDDMVISDNGDFKKVLSTVIQIIKEFTAQNPGITLVFKGSTDSRMRIYQRILQNNYSEIVSEFTVSAFVLQGGSFCEVLFDPRSNLTYWAFFIKRIN